MFVSWLNQLVEEVPANGENALVHVSLVQGSEERRGHVKRAKVARGALVHDSGVLPDPLLLVQNGHGFTAMRLAFHLGRVDSHDVLVVVRRPTARTEPDLEEGCLAPVRRNTRRDWS